MNKEIILQTIKNEKTFIQKHFGVREIALFGSYARGEEKVNSDVDILVSLTKPSYNLLMGLNLFLENKLNSKIELVRQGPHLSKQFMEFIQHDLIYV